MEFPLHVLSEYALLADGERGILVGPRGDFAWMSAPRWDSDAVFSTLIGGPGVYAVTPAEPSFVWGGYYEPGTLIWRSRWVTTAQEIECREALGMTSPSGRCAATRRRRSSMPCCSSRPSGWPRRGPRGRSARVSPFPYQRRSR